MAIGTGLALLGTAAISAGAGLLGSKKQANAARDASQITQEDNAANRAFLSQIYGSNVGYLSPWMQTGQQANNAFMELLGYPQAQQQPMAFAGMGGGYGAPQVAQAPSAFGGWPAMSTAGGSFGNEFVPDYSQGMTAVNGRGAANLARARANASPQMPLVAQGPSPVPGGVTVPAPSAQSAFDTYRGSTGYDFRFNEGLRALQSAFSRNLESGASTKAAMRFGQGIASDEFGRYMDLLRGQSQLGLSGASALAGVGQNFGGQVVAGNQAAANTAANSRLYTGQLAAQNWANIGSSFGNALGYFAK